MEDQQTAWPERIKATWDRQLFEEISKAERARHRLIHTLSNRATIYAGLVMSLILAEEWLKECTEAQYELNHSDTADRFVRYLTQKARMLRTRSEGVSGASDIDNAMIAYRQTVWNDIAAQFEAWTR